MQHDLYTNEAKTWTVVIIERHCRNLKHKKQNKKILKFINCFSIFFFSFSERFAIRVNKQENKTLSLLMLRTEIII